MQKILYLIQKEFRQLLREKANLVIVFVMPFIQLIIFGFAITLDVTNIPIVMVDQDGSQMSRRIIHTFENTRYFSDQGTIDSTAQAINMMQRGIIKIAVIIPQHFEKNLKKGLAPNIQVILDGVDGNSAGIASGYVAQISKKLQMELIKKINTNTNKIILPQQVNIQTRMYYNPNLKSVNNIIPGVLALLLTMITLLLTSINVVKEREIGTLEQLNVSPIKSWELIIGKIFPFIILGFIMLNIGILTTGIIFNLWIKGNILILYLLSCVYIMTTLGIGILISTFVRTQQQAMFFAWFIMLCAFILSGFFVPIENMPKALQYLTFINPLRYFMIVVRSLYLKGTSLMNLLPELEIMLLFGIGTLSFAIVRFKKI